MLCYRLRGSGVIRRSQVTTNALSGQRERVRDRTLNTALSSGRGWACFKDLLDGLFILKIVLIAVVGNQVPSHLKQHPNVTCSLFFCLRMVCCERKRSRKTYERCTTWVSTSPTAVLGPVCTSWEYWLIF